MQKSIEVQCGSCSGTGLYRGFAEPQGVAVVCLQCDGTGKGTIRYTPFTGQIRRNDVKTVQLSRGTFLATGIGPGGSSISYEEFMRGQRPK